MKLFKKVSAGLLLSLGFLCLLSALGNLLDEGKTQGEKQDSKSSPWTGLVVALPFVAGGGWIVWGLYKQNQKEVSDRLQSIFLRLLQEGNGQITVVRFAIEAQLSAEAAKQYLDEKAKHLNATFGAGEQGGISYYFNI